MPTKTRYTRQLQLLIERYGEDMSLSEALRREQNRKDGRPSIDSKEAYRFYILVEMACTAGYKPTPACDLLAEWLNGKPCKEQVLKNFVRSRYRTGRKLFGAIFAEDRDAVLKWHGADNTDWLTFLRDHPAR